jgi:hypothetical protein
MKTADELFEDIFSKPRDPRSIEYKRGVLSALRLRLEQMTISNPFPAGTAAADAFDAGVEEGHLRWRIENERLSEQHQTA